MSDTRLESSFELCHRIMRISARNFYWGMKRLPPPRRRAMYCLYAYMRLLDDIADDSTHVDRAARLEQWRQMTQAAYSAQHPADGIWPALTHTVREFFIPLTLLEQAIDGQLQDLTQPKYRTFADLYQYCYRVASTVGIAAVHIWGCNDAKAFALAEKLGVAMQLTNILRDVREDAARGRRYLADEDCAQVQCPLWNENQQTPPPHWRQLAILQIDRASAYYRDGDELVGLVDPTSSATLRVMIGIYHGILKKIAANPDAVWTRRVSLSLWQKLRIAWSPTSDASERP